MLALVVAVVVVLLPQSLPRPVVPSAEPSERVLPGDGSTSSIADLAIAAATASLRSEGPDAVVGTGWHSSNAQSHPPARSDASEAYDPALGEVVLYGGYANGTYLNDTWVYFTSAGGAGFWKQIFPAENPGARSGAAIAFDVASGKLVLFGGHNASGISNATWSFDSAGWTNLNADGATAVWDAGLAFDPYLGRLILFGGIDVDGFTGSTFQYDAGRWTGVLGSPSPYARAGFTFSWDPGRSSVILSGGIGSGGLFSDTWAFHNLSWFELTSVGSGPTFDEAASAYDPVDGVLLAVGGNSSAGPTGGTYGLPAEGGWSLLPSAVAPSNRSGASLAFDEGLGESVLFGGWSGGALSDTWQFSLATPPVAWRSIGSGTNPPRRSESGMAYDPAIGAVVMFGGLVGGATGNGTAGADPNPAGKGPGAAFLGDTWAYANGTWTNLTTGIGPSPRRAPSMAFDPREGYLLLFGGSNATGYLNDTWAYQNGHWNPLTPRSAPSPRREAGLTYDAADADLLLYGGVTGSIAGANYTYLDDLWSFAEGNWTLVTPVSGPSENPPGLAAPEMEFDPGTGMVVLFGGYRGAAPNGSGELVFGGTYTYSGATWTNLTAVVSAHAPAPRFDAGFAFDDAFGGLVLSSGETAAGALTDTWEYRDGAWTELCGKCAPAGNADNGVVWDPGIGAAVAWGTASANGPSTTSFFVGPFTLVGSAIPSSADRGTPVDFSAEVAGGIAPWSAEWNVSDGTGATVGWNVTHTFSSNGTFTVNLTVRDGLGDMLYLQQNVTVVGEFQVGFSAGPWGPKLDGARLRAWTTGGAGPFTFRFAFGDGNFQNVTEASQRSVVLEHQYPTGTFSPSVQVTDGGGGLRTAVGAAFAEPAEAPTVGVVANRTLFTPAEPISVQANDSDRYGPVNYSWSVAPAGSGSFGDPTAADTTFHPRSSGPATVRISTVDAENFSATGTINLTVVPLLQPAFNITVPNRIDCPITNGSASVTLNATARGGEPPYVFEWNWTYVNTTGPNVVARLTPGVSALVVLTVEDAAGDNASVGRSVLVPPATCSPGLGLASSSTRLLLEIGIGVVVACIAVEVVIILRRRRALRPPPPPVDE